MIRLDCVRGEVIRLNKVTLYGVVKSSADHKVWGMVFSEHVITAKVRSLMMNFIKYTVGKE